MKLRPKFDKLWKDAIKANREAQWCYLPENISDFVESIDKLAESEIKFLCLRAINFDRRDETEASIRTLCLIYEFQKESIILMTIKYLMINNHPLRYLIVPSFSGKLEEIEELMTEKEKKNYF